MDASAVRERLAGLTVPGELWVREGEKLRCTACGHRCSIAEGREGICRVRFVRGGSLRVPAGYVAALQADPVEKKPFFHLLPGATALSFGMLGCDLSCPYCQNWEISQVLRDEEAGPRAGVREITAAELVGLARAERAEIVTSTYNEPLITAEWAVEVFRLARAAGLVTSVVSNGHGTPEAVAYLAPWLDAFKVDLKGIRPEVYRRVGGRMEPVLETLKLLVDAGVWVEVVTLVVPGLNDDEADLRASARFLAGLGRGIPWHLTAFHGDYRMADRDSTSPAVLERAARVAREEGLLFVYTGNVPGGVPGGETTRCPSCGFALVERRGYRVLACRIGPDGACSACGAAVPGRWHGPGGTRSRGYEVAR